MNSINPDSTGRNARALRLRRAELAENLTAAGFPIQKSTLAKLAATSGGPPYQRFGRWVVYDWNEALKWAEAKLSAPVERYRDLTAT